MNRKSILAVSFLFLSNLIYSQSKDEILANIQKMNRIASEQIALKTKEVERIETTKTWPGEYESSKESNATPPIVVKKTIEVTVPRDDMTTFDNYNENIVPLELYWKRKNEETEKYK